MRWHVPARTHILVSRLNVAPRTTHVTKTAGPASPATAGGFLVLAADGLSAGKVKNTAEEKVWGTHMQKGTSDRTGDLIKQTYPTPLPQTRRTDMSKAPDALQKREEKTFTIDGMSCDHCVSAVRDALSEVNSVEVVEAEIGSATVRFDPDVTNHIEIAAAIADAGYTVVSSS